MKIYQLFTIPAPRLVGKIRPFNALKNHHPDVSMSPKPKDLELPPSLDWENPSEIQLKWMDKIKKASQYAVFDIFQEYGVQLKDGVAQFHKGGKLGLVERLQHSENHYDLLEEVFMQELREEDTHYGYYKDPENRWRYYTFLRQKADKYQVIGGGNALV